MNNKEQRQATIRRIIRDEVISSQEELIARLSECGIAITQSTLSRDLKAMNVVKSPHATKGYIYMIPHAPHHEVSSSANISDNIVGLVFSGNLAILKTKPGYASAISVSVDNLECPDILGSIAGDNTILIILSEEYSRSTVIESLSRAFPTLIQYI